MRAAIALSVFAAAFIALTVSSYTQKSATVDEPQHLTSGYASLKLGDYRLDPDHPPFLRMWAAAPLLAMRDVKFDTHSRFWLPTDTWNFSHQFLYADNEADRLLYRARFMVVLLGVLLGGFVFWWAKETSFAAGCVVLALFCVEPNLLAHSSLVTTDLGVTCFLFGTIFFLRRLAGAFNAANLGGLTLFFALSQISKFSALLLWPVVVALLLVIAFNPQRRWKVWRVVGVCAWLAGASYLAIWAAYGFRHAPTPPASGLLRVESVTAASERWPRVSAALTWADQHHWLPNVYAQGLSTMLAKAQDRPSYLAGRVSQNGWWYYFPVAFALKTPLALVLLFLAGLALCAANGRRQWRDDIFLVLPAAMFLFAAMAGSVNIGLRHILPIYPFVLVLAGKAVAAILPKLRTGVAIALTAVCVLEPLLAYPDFLGFFNGMVGGPRHGHKYLLDSNLDWGQDLKPLAGWMRDNDIPHVNLSYFGTADPAYYGLDCTYLPGSPFFARSRVTWPQLPGFVAVSVTSLHGPYLSEFGREFYRPLLAEPPVAVIGNSIFVFWKTEPWWNEATP